jgi:hypothetical protein
VKNSNSSQFFLTFQAAPQIDGKHVIFGELVSGGAVLDLAETFGTKDGEITVPITITDCGIFTPFETPGCGYWFDKPDTESYTGISPVFMVRPRVVVLAPTSQGVKKFQSAMGNHVSFTSVSVQETGDDETALIVAAQRISELLGTFAVDVVIIAPACNNVKRFIDLPKTWKHRDMLLSVDEVVIEAKPVEALAAVFTKSWIAQRKTWQLDGASIQT